LTNVTRLSSGEAPGHQIDSRRFEKPDTLSEKRLSLVSAPSQAKEKPEYSISFFNKRYPALGARASFNSRDEAIKWYYDNHANNDDTTSMTLSYNSESEDLKWGNRTFDTENGSNERPIELCRWYLCDKRGPIEQHKRAYPSAISHFKLFFRERRNRPNVILVEADVDGRAPRHISLKRNGRIVAKGI